jgi:hypothetical protein
LIQEVLQRERPVRTRFSVLLCRPEISSTAPSPHGPFKSLLQTLQTLAKSTANKSSEQSKHYDRYKFKEDAVWKEKLKGICILYFAFTVNLKESSLCGVCIYIHVYICDYARI